MNRVLFFFLLISAISTSCSSDRAFRYYGDNKYAPNDPSKVEKLFKAPTRRFTPIADFQAKGSSSLIDDFRNQAARIGADAIIYTLSSELYDRNTEWADGNLRKQQEVVNDIFFTNDRVNATAIKFLD